MFLAYPEFYVFYYLSSKTDFYEYFVKRNKKLLYLKRTKLKKIQDYIFIGGIFISVGIFCGGGVNWILGPALKLIEKDYQEFIKEIRQEEREKLLERVEKKIEYELMGTEGFSRAKLLTIKIYLKKLKEEIKKEVND